MMQVGGTVRELPGRELASQREIRLALGVLALVPATPLTALLLTEGF